MASGAEFDLMAGESSANSPQTDDHKLINKQPALIHNSKDGVHFKNGMNGPTFGMDVDVRSTAGAELYLMYSLDY